MTKLFKCDKCGKIQSINEKHYSLELKKEGETVLEWDACSECTSFVANIFGENKIG